MTVDQAIYILRNTAWLGSNKDRERTEEAVEMAVKALESKSSKEPVNRMDDLISRQDAIDALEKAIRENPYYDSNDRINGLGIYDVRVIINDLPSAQPKQQWIPCEKELPEEYGEYRITWTTSVSKSRFIGDAEYEVTGVWDAEHDRFEGEWLLDEHIKSYPNVKVLAWKPLEEPYRGGEEDS